MNTSGKVRTISRDGSRNTENRFLLLSGVVCVAALCAGAGLLAVGSVLFGAVLVVCGPLGFVVAVGQVALLRRRFRPRGSVAKGSPAEGRSYGAAQVVARWTGGINVPATGTGRVSATFPVGILELTESELRFSVRPALLRTVVGAQGVVVHKEDGTAIFPVRRPVGGGVGIRQHDGQTWYFWTNSPDVILSAIRSVGFTISDQPVKLL
jgi:hypothetical protein